VSIKTSDRPHSGTLSPEFALLGFLIAGPDHGYDLHQKFVMELGNIWHLSQSQAYAILKRLEKRGDITSRLIEQQKLPSRQKLSITAQGRQRFMDWLHSGCGENARSIRLELLTRLYFSNLYTPGRTARIFVTQLNEVQTTIQRLEKLIGTLPSGQVYNRLSLDLRLRQMVLIRQWMMEIRDQFHL